MTTDPGSDPAPRDRDETRIRQILAGAPPQVVADWLSVQPREVLATMLPAMIEDGLDAARARSAFTALESLTATQLLASMQGFRMAGLSLANMMWWAPLGADLLTVSPRTPSARRASRQRRSSRRSGLTRDWVSQARRFVSATRGDQRLAALACAAGLGVDETAALHAGGALVEETLVAMVAMRAWDRPG